MHVSPPKQNQQPHAWVALLFKLVCAWLHEDAFRSSEATGNLERNSVWDARDWLWRVRICHIVNSVTARACVGQTPCPFKWCVCVSLEKMIPESPGGQLEAVSAPGSALPHGHQAWHSSALRQLGPRMTERAAVCRCNIVFAKKASVSAVKQYWLGRLIGHSKRSVLELFPTHWCAQQL